MANLDLLNHFWKRAEKEKTFGGYLRAIKEARPFSLDADFAGLVGDMATMSPKSIRAYLRSARLPYPTMWIETPFANGLSKANTGRNNDWRLHQEAPTRVGWLLTQAPQDVIGIVRLALIPDADGKEQASIYPLMHMISPDRALDMEDAFRPMRGKVHPEVLFALNEFNDIATRLTCWGEGVVKEPAALANTNFVVFEPLTLELLVNPITPDGATVYQRASGMMTAGLNDQLGDLGFIVAALATINELPCKYVPYRPTGHAMIGGRMRPYMTSSVISIEVPATRHRIKEIDKHLRGLGEHAKKARHEVRGHWRHVKGLPRDDANHHRWERYYDPETNAPKGWRMWIPHHERGDASLGWVKQTYHVSKGRAQAA